MDFEAAQHGSESVIETTSLFILRQNMKTTETTTTTTTCDHQRDKDRRSRLRNIRRSQKAIYD